jgi:hypothetical protein
VDLEARGSERGDQDVAALAIPGEEICVVAIREAKGGDGRLLERRGGADGEEVVDPPYPE